MRFEHVCQRERFLFSQSEPQVVMTYSASFNHAVLPRALAKQGAHYHSSFTRNQAFKLDFRYT